MKNYAKETGKPCDNRCFRQVIVGRGRGIEQVHNECLQQKYAKMDEECKANLEKMDKYLWN